MIYLDHELASPPDDRVFEAMHQAMDVRWWPQAAPYSPPPKDVTAPLYALVQAGDQDHFVFTSSGAEAINHVLFGVYVDVTRQAGRHHFLCSALDEAPTILAMQRLEALGCHFQMIAASPQGHVTAKEFAQTLTPRTALLSLSWANGLTGVIQPIQEMAALCEERGILLHIDATHILGRGHFPFHESGAHFLTFDGEPLGAPAGTGGLFIRHDVELSPLILGGYEQNSLRAGSLCFPLLHALSTAAQLRLEQSDLFCLQSAVWRREFEETLVAQAGAQLCFAAQSRLPHVTTLLFPGVTSEALCYHLAAQHIYANMGGNRFQHLTHLLRACALPSYQSGLSFALGPQTTQEQLRIATEHIVACVTTLRRYSTHILQEAH